MMRRHMRHRLGSFVAFGALAATSACGGRVADRGTASGDPEQPAVVTLPPSNPSVGQWLDLAGPTGIVEVFAVLEGEPVARAVDAVDMNTEAGRAALRRRALEVSAQQAQIVSELETSGATVIGQLRVLANAIHVRVEAEALPTLRRIPGVVRLDRVSLHRRALRDAVPLVGAPQVWAGATPFRGDGVTLAVIDTGIDYTHADFGGPGTNEAFNNHDRRVAEPDSFPTARVIGGHDFVGDAYDPGQPGNDIPMPDPDPIDCDRSVSSGHGTHVAGIAAGNGVRNNGAAFLGPYDQSLDPRSFRVMPGVAPEASIYALKVFGCRGATSVLMEALEWAADPNQDGDPSDRVDVINGSLGNSYGIGSTTEAETITNLARIGTLVVAAAGNDGNGGRPFFSAGSPASYPEVLAVGATVNDASEFNALAVEAPESIAGEMPYVESTFAPSVGAFGEIVGNVVSSEPALGCGPFINAADVSGNIALVTRGDCPFFEKFQNARDAGALAIIIVDRRDTEIPCPVDAPVTLIPLEQCVMNGNTAVDLPGVLLRKRDGDALRAHLEEGVRIRLDGRIFQRTLGPDWVTGFSSRGPSADGVLVKPEISAPGDPIVSAGSGSGAGASQLQGTSQASPMVAGAAVLIREAHPSFGAIDVKAALVNSTAPVFGLGGEPFPVSLTGGGRLQIDTAIGKSVTAWAAEPPGAVALAFGAIIAAEPESLTRDVVIANHSDSPVTYDVGTQASYELGGVSLSVAPLQITVAPGASRRVAVTLELDPRLLPPPRVDPVTPEIVFLRARHFPVEADGVVSFTDIGDGTQSITVPYHAIVRGASDRRAGVPGVCESGDRRVVVPIDGESALSTPPVTALELILDEAPPTAAEPVEDGGAMIAAFGVATDLTVADSFDQASAYFGFAVTKPWVTPAQGPLSAVRLFVDNDLDGVADVIVVSDAVGELPDSGFSAFADTINATVVSIGESVIDPRRPVNMFEPNVVDTHPFHNDVLVLPAFLTALGLEEGRLRLNVLPIAGRPSALPEPEDFIEIDLSSLSIDTPRFGAASSPLFEPARPLSVSLGGGEDASSLPRMLLLHHANVVGRRMQIVDFSEATAAPVEDGNLAVSVDAPDRVAALSTFTTTIEVRNESTASRRGVTLVGAVADLVVSRIDTTLGRCDRGDGFECQLGDIDANGVVTIDVELRAPEESAMSAGIELEVRSSLECETDKSDNVFALTMEVGSSAPATEADLRGGCGCRTASSGSRPIGLLGLALPFLAVARRRRRAVV